MISFGVFQSYYQNHVLADYSPSAVSWVGTMQAFFLIEIGVIAGPLYDRGLLRYILAAGAVLLTLGVMFTSIATEFYSVFLSRKVSIPLGFVETLYVVLASWEFVYSRAVALPN